MRLHSLRAVQRLPVSISEAWAFFSDPRNLGRITPPWMRFEVLSPLPDRAYMEDIVHYALPFGWLGLIVNRLVVAPRLREIFGFRRRVLEELFAVGAAERAPARVP